MKPLFEVSVTSLKKVHDMPDTWSDKDYRLLLTHLSEDGFDDVPESDLGEMALMALQDMEPDDAANTVLAYKLTDRISAGVRQNIVQDLLEDQRPWEEVSDIRLHSSIFACAVLLQRAFPPVFSKPDIMQLILHVTAVAPRAKSLLSQVPEPAFVTRMLADGMSESSILERLFDEELASDNFPEAEGIIWQAKFSDQVLDEIASATLTIYSSGHWLAPMASVSEFQSNAYNDTDKEHKHGQ